jgi:hypothetical protein
MLEKSLGPDHPATALCLGNLSGVLAEQRKFPEAEKMLTRSLAVREKMYSPHGRCSWRSPRVAGIAGSREVAKESPVLDCPKTGGHSSPSF